MQLPGYKLLKKLNRGGMSTVYLAMQESLNRRVAVKVMAPALNADPVFSDRFQREAKIVGQLSHPNIIAIYDIGRHQSLNYIAMEYLPNGSIADQLDLGMTAKDTLALIKSIGSALAHAHNKGYIHRDIKPENILMRDDGTPVLSDFGVARAVTSNTQMTNAGTVLGTPNYMSPEQARGKELDGRSDIYSLGIVLYEMLTGEPPYKGEEAVAIAIAHLTAPVPKLPPKYAQLQPLLNKMAAKKPEQRFQKAEELVEAIEQILSTLNGDSTLEQMGPDTTAVDSGAGSWWYRLVPNFLRSDNSDNQTNSNADDNFISLLETISNPRTANPHTGKLLAAIAVTIVALSIGVGYWYWQSYLNIEVADTPVAAPPVNQELGEANPSTDEPLIATENLSNQDTVNDEPDIAIPKFALTVDTQPSDAIVRILNIRDKYAPGIELAPGRYEVDVQAENYYRQTQWVTIEDQAISFLVNLQPAPKPGETLRHELSDGGKGPAMVVVPRGEFIMGSLRYENSQPRHETVIPNRFAIGAYEVTWDQYLVFARATNTPIPVDQNWGKGDRPVINVSWHDANAYAQWLSEQTDQPYRLPTEAEWEYVASAAGTREFPWAGGESGARTNANCRRGCDSPYVTLFASKTAPAGSFSPGSMGVYDLGGNVEEWLNDCYKPDYSSLATAASSVPVIEPQLLPSINSEATPAAGACDQRVLRGGSFLEEAEQLNVFRRRAHPPEFADKSIGFRVLLELPEVSNIEGLK